MGEVTNKNLGTLIRNVIEKNKFWKVRIKFRVNKLFSLYITLHIHKTGKRSEQALFSWFQTFAVIWILYIFFWVFPRRQIVIGQLQFDAGEIIIIGIQPLGRFGQRPELSQSTGIALVCCILGKFLGVVCHCFPLPEENIQALFY